MDEQLDEDDERRSELTVSLWVWFALGLGFGFLCIGVFFFFFYYQKICIAILGNGVWVAFALYRLYLVFSTNDVTVD